MSSRKSNPSDEMVLTELWNVLKLSILNKGLTKKDLFLFFVF